VLGKDIFSSGFGWTGVRMDRSDFGDGRRPLRAGIFFSRQSASSLRDEL
jgi:hypothetical protein